ncbi:hypothetical protein GWA97_05975 [Flavobacterium sp. LaA7.5]|nr:hypothetical protein [Flavobacterium salilacus subsp. altitudinum]
MRLFQHIFFLLTLLVSPVLSAQDIMEFVVLNDPNDSHVNLRKTASAKSDIVKKFPNGSVLFCFGQKENWISAEYFENDELISGYIYKDLAKVVSDFTEIKAVSVTKHAAIFKDQNTYVSIIVTPFTKDNHKLTYTEDGNILTAIDGKRIWGTDGGFPRLEYKSIIINISDKIIELPKEAIHNLYEPNLDYTRIYYDEINDTLYITALNSDGAGAYTVALIIKNKKYKERVVEIPF